MRTVRVGCRGRGMEEEGCTDPKDARVWRLLCLPTIICLSVCQLHVTVQKKERKKKTYSKIATTPTSLGYNPNTKITPIKYQTTPFTFSLSLSLIKNPTHASHSSAYLDAGNHSLGKSVTSTNRSKADNTARSGEREGGVRWLR